MKTRSKLLLILLLFPALLIANNGKFNGKHTKEKTINKEYNVSPDAGLKVGNSYGNIDIVTWNENRTVIEVLIRTNGNDEEKVQKRLDEITVDFTASSSLVTAKTIFNNKKKSWSWWGSNNKVSVEVNYTIKIPVTNSVDLNNNYGAISLNRLEGNAKINCDYGQIIIGELLADNNYLNFDYTTKSTIEYMKSGKINADYSGFIIDKADRLEINADYTNSEVLEVSQLIYNCDYGKVIVGNVNSIIGNGDYVNNRIGMVNSELDLNTDYGSIKVDKLSSSFNNAKINGSYTNIKLGFDTDLNFDFNFKLTYASFNGDDLVTIKHSNKNYSKKSYSGFYGAENSGNNIDIHSNYGGITLFKN